MYSILTNSSIRPGFVTTLRCSSRYFINSCRLGSAQTAVRRSANPDELSDSVVDPLSSNDYFAVRSLVSMDSLFAARAHLGHKDILRNPYMAPYLFGCRQGVDIIDLEQTHRLLQEACNFLAHIAYREGTILFISQNKQMMPLIESTARNVGEFSFCRDWSVDVFTNAMNYFGLNDRDYSGSTQTDTQQSSAQNIRLPDCVVCLDTAHPPQLYPGGITPAMSAAKMMIPCVGIVDSNVDPRLVSYPVPGNDDSPTAVRLWCAVFAAAIKAGKKRRIHDQNLRLTQKNEHTSFGMNREKAPQLRRDEAKK